MAHNHGVNSKEIRKSFLDFFAQKGHRILPSSSLLPTAPNLLFTNAGMNPFVPYFLGERTPKDLRVADTQKCIRAGGKHNDLEEVGFDTYHHTFFEMLGNWSFGDYFKKEAIAWAWELLTEVWKFPPERLYATVYQSTEREPATLDQESCEIWTKIFVQAGLDPKTHVRYGHKKDNFWMMGDTGPCGPCSEIHMDLTPDGKTNGRLVNQGDPRCMEIWNLVFMQYNALPDGSFESLRQHYVDTGMGLERVAGIFATTQNFTDFSKIPSNYDSDLFTPIFQKIRQLAEKGVSNVHAYFSNELSVQETEVAYRILADHIRAAVFAVADGILPGNEGRNYVLRRIVRRAILFGQKLHLPTGFFADLSTVVCQNMEDDFPELKQNAALIAKVIRKEEETFQTTLERGLRLFQQWVESSARCLSGEQAFLLYDTYGFPFDLTQLMAKERGVLVDCAGFQKEMERQKQRSKAAMKKSIIQVITPKGMPTEFIGYQQLKSSSKVIEVLESEGQWYLVTEQSPFYGEKGGQVGDRGLIQVEKFEIPITRAFWQNQTLLHQVEVAVIPEIQKCLPSWKGKEVTLRVDANFRKRVSCHHTATHLLQWALRKVLGNHVHQTGSKVEDTSFRFDFSHFEKLSSEQIQSVEQLCNEVIAQNVPVAIQEVPFEERPQDCLAFFGDRYGDRVRVVSIGDVSKELCGGTHAHTTGELQHFHILKESSVGAGIRRIKAAVCEEK